MLCRSLRPVLAVRGRRSRRGALTAGDCFLLPRGLPFSLATDLTLTPVDFFKLLSTKPNGGTVSHNGGGDCFLVGGHFILTGSHADILLGVLPPICAYPERIG